MLAQNATGAIAFDNLPTRLSSFVGREREIAEVAVLLADQRLVTLVGAPGVGKTRLALRIADAARDTFSDGLAFVELAGLAEADLVPRVIASTFGVEEQGDRRIVETLISVLRGRRLLVVLDNCEHLIEACASVVETLLGACPDLRILVTSREALRCEGEVTWRVPSLSVPPSSPTDARADYLDQLLLFEAIRLFVDRARAVRPSFALTPENTRAVRAICHDLDGIPLALELAAARVLMFTPEQIAARLDGHLRLLTSGARTALPRQRTLEATIDWSYRLLPEPEQVLLRRLSVFAGGWSIEAAEAISTDPNAAPRTTEFLDLFSRLVDKSLVQVDAANAGEPRYRLLEMVRQYAFERLVDSGEVAAVRDRHRAWFLGHVERAEPLHYWAPDVDWLDRLEADHDNLRAALDWSLVSPTYTSEDTQRLHESALRLATALFWPWFNRGHIGELRWWLQELLRSPAGTSVSLLARATIGAGLLAEHQDDLTEATDLQARGYSLAEGCGDAWAMAWSLQASGLVARRRGDLASAVQLFAASCAQFRELGDTWSVAWSLRNLGASALRQDDLARARELLTESLLASRSIDDEYCASLALTYLGTCAYAQGSYDEAVRTLTEALTLAHRRRYARGIGVAAEGLGRAVLRRGDVRQAAALLTESVTVRERMGDRGSTTYCLAAFAELAAHVGEETLAVTLGAAAVSIRSSVGGALASADQRSIDKTAARLRARVGDGEFERIRSRGADMSIPGALEAAHELVGRLTAAEQVLPSPEWTGPLTPREHEVAGLVAQGMTNRQIAEQLVVSRRTVDAHVASILARLGFSTRAQIAVWAAAQSSGDVSTGR